jgi:hypothetical protein
MSAQTPQTDALVIAADGCKSVYPSEEFKPNPDWQFEPEIDAIIALSRTLEADRDRLKALCEEADIALSDWLHTYASEECKPEYVVESMKRIFENGGTLYYIAKLRQRIRAALKKAQKP